jgi:dTDP-4-amino-4,6-dideoxygalactose transaminase
MDPYLIPRLRVDYSLAMFVRGLGALVRGEAEARLALPGIDRGLMPVSSGRAGLRLILRALDLPAGSGIAVPLYCCPTVFSAIERAGHRPVFVDIGQSDFNISPGLVRQAVERDRQVRAIVAVHLFGFPADIQALRAAGGGLPIIEDCAHAVGTVVNSQPAGGHGDAAFFSFGRGKWPSVGGGAVRAADPALQQRLEAMVSALPAPTRARQAVRSVRSLATSALYRRPWYGLFALSLAQRLDDRLDLRNLRDDSVQQMDTTWRRILVDRLAEMPRELRQRRANAARLREQLEGTVPGLPDLRPGEEPNWYLFPVRFRSAEQRAAAWEHLRREGIDTMRYLADVAGHAGRVYGYQGDCANAERAADTVLVIPHYHGLSAAQIDGIAHALCEFWQNQATGRPADNRPD